MTQERPDVGRVLDELKDFQRETVMAVTTRMFDKDDPQRRFLVADEVGLGKTKIARAVVATTVDRLWDDPDVDRIDVVTSARTPRSRGRTSGTSTSSAPGQRSGSPTASPSCPAPSAVCGSAR